VLCVCARTTRGVDSSERVGTSGPSDGGVGYSRKCVHLLLMTILKPLEQRCLQGSPFSGVVRPVYSRNKLYILKCEKNIITYFCVVVLCNYAISFLNKKP